MNKKLFRGLVVFSDGSTYFGYDVYKIKKFKYFLKDLKVFQKNLKTKNNKGILGSDFTINYKKKLFK